MSAEFGEANDRVTYAGSGLTNPSAGFTLLMWAWITTDQNNFQTLARLHAGGTTVGSFATTSSGTGGPSYYTGSGSVEGNVEMGTGAWCRIAWSRSGNTGRVLVGNATIADPLTQFTGSVTTTTAPTGITLGGRAAADASEWFAGREAYVRYFDHQLTPTEALAEFASRDAVASGLVVHWPLAVDLNDVSGNGRHLSAGATPVTWAAGPPVPRPTITLNRAAETSTGLPLSRSKLIVVTRATETSAGRTLSRSKRMALGRAQETSTARGLARTKLARLSRAQETSAATTLGRSKAARIGRAVETSTARALLRSGAVVLGRVVETSTAVMLARSKRLTLRRASTTETGRRLIHGDVAPAPSGPLLLTPVVLSNSLLSVPEPHTLSPVPDA